MKRFLSVWAMLSIFLPLTKILATETTAIEAFIHRVKEANTFHEVNNIWQADNNYDQAALMQFIEKGQPLTIDYAQLASFVQKKTTAINLMIPATGGGSYTIELARYDFFTNDFQVHEMGDNGSDKLFNYTPGVYYRGVVKGYPGSVAAFSFFNNEVYGIFSMPGEGNYNVVPNTTNGKGYDRNPNYILYNEQDLKIRHMAPVCATDQLPESPFKEGANKTTTTASNKVYNNCREVRSYEVGDYAMFQKKGGTTNCTNYITAMYNNKATLYKNEGIIIVLRYIQINTTSDPYQTVTTSGGNPAPFLDKFGQVTQNTMHGCDVATLFSTRYNGSLGGIAWIKSMCSPYYASTYYGPYSFCNIDNTTSLTSPAVPTFSWDVEMSTHELGHQLGSPHTHRCCWNPPGTGTTAIDGCYTIEGSCFDPGNPAGGGTIMSYCHMTSSGINLANGFGPQPGDTIRRFLLNYLHSGCGENYLPSIAMVKSSKTLTANRECTDMMSGTPYTTYYWYDNNTADQTDDTLVLMVKKNGNNIGNMNQATFSVSTTTQAGYGSGKGDTITFPAGVSTYSKNYAMQRFWRINATATPTSAVEVIFPFSSKDTSDVNGSVPGATAPLSNYRMYKVNSPVDPTPATNFPGATAANFTIYTYGTSASSTNWSYTSTGNTRLAHMMMTNLTGGGGGFYSYAGTAVNDQDMISADVQIYPNPANSLLNIEVTGADITCVQMTDVSGRTVKTLAGTPNKGLVTIGLEDLANGLYFVQVHTSAGSITRKVVVMK